MTALQDRLRSIVDKAGSDLYRIKGIVQTTGGWQAIQFAEREMSVKAVAGPSNDESFIVFIGNVKTIVDIISDLIDLGLDAINSQVFCMGPEKLGESFAGEITFWGEMDRQHLLPNGTSAEIDSAAEMLANSFYRDGGFIAQCEFGPAAKPENIGRYFDNLL